MYVRGVLAAHNTRTWWARRTCTIRIRNPHNHRRDPIGCRLVGRSVDRHQQQYSHFHLPCLYACLAYCYRCVVFLKNKCIHSGSGLHRHQRHRCHQKTWTTCWAVERLVEKDWKSRQHAKDTLRRRRNTSNKTKRTVAFVRSLPLPTFAHIYAYDRVSVQYIIHIRVYSYYIRKQLKQPCMYCTLA